MCSKIDWQGCVKDNLTNRLDFEPVFYSRQRKKSLEPLTVTRVAADKSSTSRLTMYDAVDLALTEKRRQTLTWSWISKVRRSKDTQIIPARLHPLDLPILRSDLQDMEISAC